MSITFIAITQLLIFHFWLIQNNITTYDFVLGNHKSIIKKNKEIKLKEKEKEKEKTNIKINVIKFELITKIKNFLKKVFVLKKNKKKVGIEKYELSNTENNNNNQIQNINENPKELFSPISIQIKSKNININNDKTASKYKKSF